MAATLLFSTYAHADDSETHIRAALAGSGDVARLTVVNGGKKPGVRLVVGKSKPTDIYPGEAAATIEAGHGKILIAVSIDSKKKPFQLLMLDAGKLGKPIALARPGKTENYPFAVVATTTPDGFTVFFQEVETANPNEAHTYMVELDKDGAISEELREVQIPWALAAAAWNGNGYHLGLLYTGEGAGARLSMVSTTSDGTPQGHPDWSSQAGAISDVHLVASGSAIRAFYRGTGGHLFESDVSKIGQWGQVSTKAKDLGALPMSQAIAITAKGAATKVSAK
ncbi:MAG TPA: hypothetical protein VIV40_40190 [Kofleriaceae bacterium]